MKQRKLKKRIKNDMNTMNRIIENAHDIAVAKEVLFMLYIKLSDNKNATTRDYPFMDEELNSLYFFLYSKIEQLTK